MVVVRVSHSPLVAGLRSATDLDPMNLAAFQVFLCSSLIQSEHEDPRGVGIGQYCGIARKVFIKAGQMIRMWLIASRCVVVSHRSCQLERLEEFIRTQQAKIATPLVAGSMLSVA